MGAPGSGRTTFLRTVAASIALTTTPRQVSVYGMDLAGGGLGRIEGFPHVGGVATRADRNRLLRLVEELQAMIRLRERVFRDHGIDSLAMLRSRHAAGRVPSSVPPTSSCSSTASVSCAPSSRSSRRPSATCSSAAAASASTSSSH
ncbi:FtsK/SpoIIIE domain-containing protein [Curtobacterium flaccumfaciens]|nr:FtsK/SpoIIIE domain-containing protein [Curtobacterium flaccumfaciens]